MRIKVDSRKVLPGDTFIALRGVGSDGHEYIEKAIEKGAIKIICEEGSYRVETVVVPDTRKYLVEYLTTTYKKELRDMTIIGITGTNGKTTTGYLTYQLLIKLGLKSAYIGTLGFYTNQKERDLVNTTPDIWDIFDLLLESHRQGCRYLVMEVSSIAIEELRIEGLLFDFAVFTNLSQDHLDYHKTMGAYKEAKLKLFSKLKKDGKAIINIDDEVASDFAIAANNNITFGIKNSNYKIVDYDIQQIPNILKVKKDNNEYEITSNLIGKYNLYNSLVAFIIGVELTNNPKIVSEKMSSLISPSGRMDTVNIEPNNVVIIDYAHTPDAVLNVLKTVNEIKQGRVYTVIGCGGDRDKTKRPIMAKIATDYSDMVIITSDNPRFEEPKNIITDMITDLKNDNYIVELDRGIAIQKGIDMLDTNDFLLILGKGHETYQEIKGVRHHFDDKEQVNNYFEVVKEN